MAVSHTRMHFVRWLLYAALAGSFGVVIVVQRVVFERALLLAADSAYGWLAVSAAGLGLSLVCAAMVYKTLLPHRLPFGPTLLVQAAGLFAGKLLPAGSGALGVSYLYLRRRKLSRPAAAAIIVANNALGVAGHIVLLGLLSLAQPSIFTRLTLPRTSLVEIVSGGTLLVAAGVVGAVWWRHAGKRFVVGLCGFWRHLQALRQRPRSLLRALLWSCGITLSYVLALFAVGQALGLPLGLFAMLVVLSVGVLATSLIPAPGGIGAAEAGIFVGLRLYEISGTQALGAALLYRLMTFWLPLLVGGVAFVVTSKQHLI